MTKKDFYALLIIAVVVTIAAQGYTWWNISAGHPATPSWTWS